MTRKTAIVTGLAVLAVLAVGAYAANAFMAGAREGEGWEGLGLAWPYLLAGGATVAAVLAAFVWLALWSERKGYDDRAGDGQD